MNERDRVCLQRTLDRAKQLVPVAGARVAATIVVDDRWSFSGENSRKTHPMQAKWGKNDKAICLHAEIDAIRSALRRFIPEELNGSAMYIARAKADGSPGLAKPCEGCKRAIVAFGISEVYWTE